MRSRLSIQPIDGALLLMTVIWGSNFSVIKVALREFPILGFNALRLVLASLLFLIAIRWSRGPRAELTRRDWYALAGLGLIGHFIYQLCFMGGVANTTVANGSLIISTGPVAVALLSALLGVERISRGHWAGAALSVLGIYVVAGRGASIDRASITGDLLMLASVLCWAVYTLGSRPLLTRHSPLVVTGWSMAIGSIAYVPLGIPDLMRLDWAAVTPAGWAAMVYSSVLALCVAYLIWYTGVQRLGSARTSIYSNVVPIAAVTIAALWLGEPVTSSTIGGAVLILAGVTLTKLGSRPAAAACPPEE